MAEMYRHPMSAEYGPSGHNSTGDTPEAPGSFLLDMEPRWSQIVDDDLYESTSGSIASGTLSAAGESTTSLIGASFRSGVLTASGDATASLAGHRIAAGVLGAAGDATSAMHGVALAVGAMAASGEAIASLAGRAFASGAIGAAGETSTTIAGRAFAAGSFGSAGEAGAVVGGGAFASAMLGGDGEATASLHGGDQEEHDEGETATYGALGIATWSLTRPEPPPRVGFAVASMVAAGASSTSLIGHAVIAPVPITELVSVATRAPDVVREVREGAFEIVAGAVMAASASTLAIGEVHIMGTTTSTLTGEQLFDAEEVERRVAERLAEQLQALRVGVQIRVQRPPARRRTRGA